MRTNFMTLKPLLLLGGILMSLSSGCTSLGIMVGDIPAIPANRVPAQLLGRARNDMIEVSISRLRQQPPKIYEIGPDDILGIYIETVLGKADEPPPVSFPEKGDQAPALGYPIPVREDGSIALPLVDPINVEGLTLSQATDSIRKAYTIDKKILPAGKDRIIVTLIKKRQKRVLVIREESGNNSGNSTIAGSSKRGFGKNIDLDIYENDLLHALNETGGLPGLDVKNEIFILRGNSLDGIERDRLLAQLKNNKQPCQCEPNAPIDPSVTVIPLRFYADNIPTFTEKDIILETGDVVYIASREREVFYTGGQLRGGEIPLPRDYDLDVIAAVSLAGGSITSGSSGISQIGGSGGGRNGGAFGPSRLIVLRKTCDGGQLAMYVDLNQALIDPSLRILVQPGDTLILRYTACEEVFNTALSIVNFNFLFNGLSGSGLR